MEEDKKFCSSCGAEVPPKAVICVKCGVPVSRGGDKTKMTAFLLALFLGGFGLHRYYLRQQWWWVYLLLCWTLVPSVVALVEGIGYLMLSDQQFDAKYNRP